MTDKEKKVNTAYSYIQKVNRALYKADLAHQKSSEKIGRLIAEKKKAYAKYSDALKELAKEVKP